MQVLSVGILKHSSNTSGSDACCVSSMRAFADAAAAHGKFCHIKSQQQHAAMQTAYLLPNFPAELRMHLISSWLGA